MLTESLSKSVSLKLTVSISLPTEKNKQTHKHCIHLFIHEMYHKLALGLTRTAALHLLHNATRLAVIGIIGQNC